MNKISAVLLSLFLSSCQSGDNTYTDSIEDYGIVRDMSSCYAGKYRYRCKVTTTKFIFDHLAVDEFPDDRIEVGDSIYHLIRQYSYGKETFMCKNGSCVAR